MTFEITEQPNVFADEFLDIIGNEFKFDHVKGLAEWIKNSADAYTRASVPEPDQFIYLSFRRQSRPKLGQFACIDFVGMSSEDIDQAFKRWGDRGAAGRGTGKRMLGGHGNGGKFYMRQMFARSFFVTYKNGLLNVFGFNERKKYGYATGIRDRAATIDEALAFAGMLDLPIPRNVRERWARGGEGLTVVIGEGPDRVKTWLTQIRDICQRLKVHPQSRRLVKYKSVYVWMGTDTLQHLQSEEIPGKPGFEGPYEWELPATLEYGGEQFAFRNRRYPSGSLVIWTSAVPFGRSGERSALNSVDVLGEAGCIGSYRMNELGYLKHGAQAEFLYGECLCPILEDPADDCVRNDREKLIDNEKSRALLSWIRDCVDQLGSKIADKENQERKRSDLYESSALNQLLDKWKNRFMGKLFAEVLAGVGPGDAFGDGDSGGEEPWHGEGHPKGTGNPRKGGGGGNEGGGAVGDKPRRAPRFPRVLLSGYDVDPLDHHSSTPFDLDPRHPSVYQRAQDVAEGIYWINTSRPLAQRIIAQYGVKSTRWRDYLFQRYMDIIQKEALYQLARRDPEFTVEKVDDVWDKVQSQVHDAAADDLEAFLFEEAFASGAL